jgi:hypothetical protein
MALATDPGHIFDLAETQAMGGTGRHAGGLMPVIDPVHAVVAFDHFANFTVPLGRAPGTRRNACFAADTQLAVDKDDAVLPAFLHGAGGAGGDAPGIFAVVARHENVSRPGQAAHFLWTHLDDLTQPGACGKVFVGFALNFARAATNAFTGILKQVVLTHVFPPLVRIDSAITSTETPDKAAIGCRRKRQKQISYHQKSPTPIRPQAKDVFLIHDIKQINQQGRTLYEAPGVWSGPLRKIRHKNTAPL